jgi:hypothetical protein
MSNEYIGINIDGICCQSALSGRTVSTFKVNIKQAKVSKISIWHPQDNNAIKDHHTPYFEITVSDNANCFSTNKRIKMCLLQMELVLL